MITKRTLLLALAAPLSAKSANAQKPKKRQPPIADTDQARHLVRALRSIESRTASGLNVSEFSKEVGDLRIAADALTELLERRGDHAMLQQVREAIEPWQDAKEIWGVCIRDCQFQIIALALGNAPALIAKDLLSRYPALNKLESQGGVLADENATNNPGRIFYPNLLSELFLLGAKRARALRVLLDG